MTLLGAPTRDNSSGGGREGGGGFAKLRYYYFSPRYAKRHRKSAAGVQKASEARVAGYAKCGKRTGLISCVFFFCLLICCALTCSLSLSSLSLPSTLGRWVCSVLTVRNKASRIKRASVKTNGISTNRALSLFLRAYTRAYIYIHVYAREDSCARVH